MAMSYQDRMAAEYARDARVAQQVEARSAELAAAQQVADLRAAEQAAREQEHDAWLKKVQQTREAVANGTLKPETGNPLAQLNAYFTGAREQEQALEDERKQKERTEPPVWVHTMPLPPNDPLVAAAKLRRINGE